MSDAFRIIVCGEGGQGVLSVAKIIAYAAWMQGKQAVYVPYFSTEKRGGTSMAFAQIGDEPIVFPKFAKADLWVAMSQRAVDRIYDQLDDGTKVIVNSTLVKDTSRIDKWKPFLVDAGTLAKVKLKKPRTFNMILMGAMLALIPGMDKEAFGKALEKQFGKKYDKDHELKALNEKALEMGYDLVK